MRVRLRGPAGNPLGIGAVVRLKFGDRFGPAREIHGGSGYWSEDSAVQVMSGPGGPTQIWVRWPGWDDGDSQPAAVSQRSRSGFQRSRAANSLRN